MIVENYNVQASLNGWPRYTYVSNTINTVCTVAGVLGGTYGKYINRDIDATVIMEYENFLPFLLPYLPVISNTFFNNYINANPLLLE